MLNTLSIRAYSLNKIGHSHSFHQLVIPLRGIINIEVDEHQGKVTPGECLVIKKGNLHHFTANTKARFLVADMEYLPENISLSNTIVFSINQLCIRFINFLEIQLEHQVDEELERISYLMFFELMSKQTLLKPLNNKIRDVVEFVENNLTEELPIAKLASISCLSPTQFKKRFKEQVGSTAAQYVTQLRMEKAKALLVNTDYPLTVVAEKVGYTDFTAFSRRFSKYFGLSPSSISN